MLDKVFHYTPTLPTDRDWIRFYLGDINGDRAELDDREIDALLTEEDEPEVDPITLEEPTAAQWRSYRKLVASRAAEAIAAKHAPDSDVSFDNQRVAMSAKFAQFSRLAVKLKAEAQSAVPLKVIRW